MLDLPSFPTRRSSDLVAIAPLVMRTKLGVSRLELLGTCLLGEPSGILYRDEESLTHLMKRIFALRRPILRSEEHTSELQSPMYLVCRLLLEKKRRRHS